jgi:hypothetical protein
MSELSEHLKLEIVRHSMESEEEARQRKSELASSAGSDGSLCPKCGEKGIPIMGGYPDLKCTNPACRVSQFRERLVHQNADLSHAAPPAASTATTKGE